MEKNRQKEDIKSKKFLKKLFSYQKVFIVELKKTISNKL